MNPSSQKPGTMNHSGRLNDADALARHHKGLNVPAIGSWKLEVGSWKFNAQRSTFNAQRLPQHNIRLQHGWTLIESIAVLAVIAVLVAVMVPPIIKRVDRAAW